MRGLRVAAAYGFFPSRLGFCGPQDKRRKNILSRFLSGGKIAENKIESILKKFEGAYPYYRLIARCNNIKDPFEKNVVNAYWIGNKLLENVSINDMRRMIVEDFTKPGLLSLAKARKKAKEIPAGSKPYHCFHVLYMGSVTGRLAIEGESFDLCRIGWGKVEKITDNGSQKANVTVRYRPLAGKKELRLAENIKRDIIWNKQYAPRIKAGDWISFHWGNVVQKLRSEDVNNLKKYTVATLNRLAAR